MPPLANEYGGARANASIDLALIDLAAGQCAQLKIRRDNVQKKSSKHQSEGLFQFSSHSLTIALPAG
jgi:hypothetical protein